MSNPILGTLPQEVAEARGAMASATVLINGFSARLEQGIAQALQNGATEAELAPLGALVAELDLSTQELAAAVQANS